ncbi:MAG: protein arginine kinase [Planctomycetota bacterium]|nr:MAG: protein arginine kinase [Planctomycetota bacterium]
MELTDLAERAGEWLSGTGPESDIVISCRIRLARNLRGFTFLTRASDEEKKLLEQSISGRLAEIDFGKKTTYLPLHETDMLERLFLVERHLISKELAAAESPRGVMLGDNESLAIMVNEEDHLRIQAMRSGLELSALWNEINGYDQAIERKLDYAFSSQFGYLTSCPTNVGTGMRVSVMMHLPVLVMTKQIEKVFQAMNKIGLAVRGLYGERTRGLGDFYQISNQVTLGKDEETIVHDLAEVIPKVMEYERKWRESLLKENRAQLEDAVYRAQGLLSAARVISSEETMNLLSSIRMGVNLGLITGIPIAKVNELFIQTQPAHLQIIEGRALQPEERDQLRARFIRQRLDLKAD